MSLTSVHVFAVATALTAVVTSALPTPASTRRPTVRLENGVVLNSRSGYYFALPQGWVLDGASDYQDVKVIHPESGATFSIHYDHTPGNARTVYLALIMSIQSPDYHWLTLGKGEVTLGGRPAMGIRGTREQDGAEIKEFMWAAVVDEYVYLLSSTVALDQYEPRAPDIDLIFSSFRWGKPTDSQLPAHASPAAVELEKGRVAYLKKDLKQAENHFRAAVKLMPDSYTGHLYLGHSIYYQHRFSEAIPEYQKAKELGASSGELTRNDTRLLNDQLGMSYGLSGQVQLAKQLFEAAIESDPDYAMYYFNLACAHAEMDNLDEVLSNLKRGFEHRKELLDGEEYPNPRKDDSFKRYLGNDRFEAAMREMGY